MEKTVKMHIVPHTHWDREWYFTLEEYRFRLVRLFDLLLDCMDDGRITYFTLDGQTIALYDYLTVRPENTDRVRALTRAGRLIIGPWYTQPNVYMSCAEAQVRNLQRGKADIAKWGGDCGSINYMPDMFGYTSQLPQMMRQFGLDCLVGARGLPLGCDTFLIWEGADGTEVRVCALPHSYINACAFTDDTERKVFHAIGCELTLPSLPDRLEVVMSELSRSPSPNLLALNGVDHMFPNPRMLETIDKIHELHPEVEAVQSTFAAYLADVEKTLTRPVTHISGEQRDGRENLILPASQSMRMDVKLRNNEMESRLIREAEPLLAEAGVAGLDRLPSSELSMAWEILLQNHAHDSLCCSNSEPSYREIMTRYDKIDDISREVINEVDQRFFRIMKDAPGECILLRNPSPFPRTCTRTVEVIASSQYRTYPEPELYVDGVRAESYITGIRTDTLLRFIPSSGLVGQLPVAIFSMTVDAGEIPALGYKTVEIRGGHIAERPFRGLVTAPDTIENKYLQAKILPDGTVTLKDLTTGEVYSGLNRFLDEGEAGNGFQHERPYHDEAFWSSGTDMVMRTVENDPLRGCIAVTQTMMLPRSLDGSRWKRSDELVPVKITTEISLASDSRVLEFNTLIDNTAGDHRFRVCFPTDTDTATAYAGQPFDVIERPVQPEHPNLITPGIYEPEYFGYHPMHDFCGISDGVRGAAAAGEGILEYEVLPDRNTLSLTLLRATDRLLVGVLGVGEKFRLPAAQLYGERRFRYAFVPHAGGYENALRNIESFLHPVRAVQYDFLEEQFSQAYAAPEAYMPVSAGFISVEGELVMTSLKSAEDGRGIIFRGFNPIGREINVSLTVDPIYTLTSALHSRLDETDGEALDCTDNRVTFTAAAKEIITLRLIINNKLTGETK